MTDDTREGLHNEHLDKHLAFRADDTRARSLSGAIGRTPLLERLMPHD